MQYEEELRTRRTKAKYGMKTMIAGNPVVIVKSGHKMDYATPEEILEDLYGKQVESIVFKKKS